ncbi:MAG: LamG-like jellyroll fold domain-containing protein [Limisphaerales bacterium]
METSNSFFRRPTGTGSLFSKLRRRRLLAVAVLLAGLQMSVQGQPAGSDCNPPSGIVAWWPGEGNANEIIGGHNGMLLNGTSFTVGEVGQAFSFDGTSAGVHIASAPSLNLGAGGGLTIECWINPADVTQQQPLVEWNSGSIGAHFWLAVPLRVPASSGGTGPGSLFVNLVDVNAQYHLFASPSNLLVAHAWQHVAVTYDKGTGNAAFYVNGNMVSQTAMGIFTPLTTGDLYFGFRPFGIAALTRYAGGMDEISLYNRALTAQEIHAIYATGTAGKCPAGSTIGDGIPDSWRQKYFGTNFVNDPRAAATADPDGDGANNYQEFLAGTDPLDANSVPSVLLVSTYAGSTSGYRDAFRLQAKFDGGIDDLKLDSQGRLWLVEGSASGYAEPGPSGERVRIIDTNGMVSTLAGGPPGLLDGPASMARFSILQAFVFDSAGNAFIVDRGNHRIRKLDTNNIVSTFAGSSPGYLDGIGTNAQFNVPRGIAIDGNDNLYVADWFNLRIRKVTPQGQVTTFSGTGARGSQDGDRLTATYGGPSDIVMAKDGTLYIADWANGTIRKIDTNGMVKTFASGLSYIEDVSLDAEGNVYAWVFGDHTLKKFRPDGSLGWSLGGTVGYQDGPAAVAEFDGFGHVVPLPNGDLLAADIYRVRKITMGVPPLLAISPDGGTFTSRGQVTITSGVPNGTIHYTLDNAPPTTNTPVYSGQLTLTNSVTVLAQVFLNGLPVSSVVTSTVTVVQPACVLPPAGLIGWWPGDGNADDIIGGHNGTLLTNTTFVAGEVGQAFHLDGFSAGVVVSNTASLNFGPDADFSIEAWINLNPLLQQQWFTIVDKRNAPEMVGGVQYGGAVGYALFLQNGRLSAELGQAPLAVWGHINYFSSQPDLRDGKFHHVAVSIRRAASDGGKLYVDGQVVLTFDPTSERGDLSNGEPLRIGNPATPGLPSVFAGMIDEVALYNRALTAQEVQAIFTADIAGKCKTDQPPGIGIQPQSQNAVFGAGVTFTVSAGGSAPLTYQWTFNGNDLPGATNATLTLTNLQDAQAGTYGVRISNALGTVTSVPVTLAVAAASPPSITLQPQSQTVDAGADVTLTVGVNGTAPFSYQWLFNTTPVPGATNASLFLRNVQAAEAGTYAVNITNVAGSATSFGTVLQVTTNSTGGTVVFANLGGGVNAPIYDVDGVTTLASPAFLAQLYAGAAANALVAISPAVPFATQGYFLGGVRSIPDVPAGTLAYVQVRVWESVKGATFEQAEAAGGKTGVSSVLAVTTGGSGAPPSLPASLLGLTSFSLTIPPQVVSVPVNQNVSVGANITLTVQASGGTLQYQWQLNGTNIPGATNATFVVNQAQAANAGTYTVKISNGSGSVTSSPITVTVNPPDQVPPVVTIASPQPGTTDDEQVHLTGTATDNVGVVSARLERNGLPAGDLAVTNNQFNVASILLNRGTNDFRVIARDAAGNEGAAEVLVVWTPSRILKVISPATQQEGGLIDVPLSLTSPGDVDGITFILHYDPNYLSEPQLIWSSSLDNALKEATYATPGQVQATFALPAAALPAGAQPIGDVIFRARSVPSDLTTLLTMEILDAALPSGEPILFGMGGDPGQAGITKRHLVGDNNANDRLDIGDATVILRLATGLDPVRDWDIASNDLNQNSHLDIGDVIRVLRVVVGLDSQPQPAGVTAQSAVSSATRPVVALANLPANPLTSSLGSATLGPSGTRGVVGQTVTVQVRLQNLGAPISGASFAVNYPTNALRLLDTQSYHAASLVPVDAFIVWNVAPQQTNYGAQSGRISFAATSPTIWSSTNGLVAELNFQVQPLAATQYRWPVTLTDVEVTADNGFDNYTLPGSQAFVIGRDPIRSDFGSNVQLGTDGAHLRLNGEFGVPYLIEVSTNLVDWAPLTSGVSANGLLDIVDPDAGKHSKRFYRAIQAE